MTSFSYAVTITWLFLLPKYASVQCKQDSKWLMVVCLRSCVHTLLCLHKMLLFLPNLPGRCSPSQCPILLQHFFAASAAYISVWYKCGDPPAQGKTQSFARMGPCLVQCRSNANDPQLKFTSFHLVLITQHILVSYQFHNFFYYITYKWIWGAEKLDF